MRLSANLLLIVVPLQLCAGEVVPILAMKEKPSLRSAPTAAASAREHARSLRALNTAAGVGGEALKGVLRADLEALNLRTDNPNISEKVRLAKLKNDAQVMENLLAPYTKRIEYDQRTPMNDPSFYGLKPNHRTL